jgi:hypothetical protein
VLFADMANGRPQSRIDDAALLEATVLSTQDAVISTDLGSDNTAQLDIPSSTC